MMERSLVLIKPDGVQRGLTGKILSRFEEIGLKVVGIKMVQADENLAGNHYFFTDEWADELYAKSKAAKEKTNQPFPFTNAGEYARMIQGWNKKFLMEGPIVAIVLEGPHAIELVRKHVGHTEPRQALPGTIRGDLTFESYQISDTMKRPIRNLVHASGSVSEAKREIVLWFSEKELYSYQTPHDAHVPEK